MKRGGISIISKDYAEANNKFLKSYNSNKPTSHIIYLDVNNLYCYSLMQLLPNQILEWVGPEKFNLDSYTDDIQQDVS